MTMPGVPGPEEQPPPYARPPYPRQGYPQQQPYPPSFPQPGYGPPPGYPQAPFPPGTGYGQPLGPKPPTNLVWGILATLLCCLPGGIVSIVYASQVSSKWSVGDWAGAQDSSRKAALWAGLSAVAGVLLAVVLFSLGVFSLTTPTPAP